jgi:hypothetical protein
MSDVSQRCSRAKTSAPRLVTVSGTPGGNGRVGRLILNLLLVRLGYPPAIIDKGDRSRYLGALRRPDQGEHGPLGEFLARAILDNLHRFVVPAIAGPARLVPLPALATPLLSANALRVAATRGRLKAAKAADGTWRSSKAFVDEYVASRYRRRELGSVWSRRAVSPATRCAPITVRRHDEDPDHDDRAMASRGA